MPRELKWRAENADIPPAWRAVLVVMCDVAHDMSGAGSRASNSYLAHETGYTQREVQNIRKILRDKGYIYATAWGRGGRGHPTEYIVCLSQVPMRPGWRKKNRPIKDEIISPFSPIKDEIISPFSPIKDEIISPKPFLVKGINLMTLETSYASARAQTGLTLDLNKISRAGLLRRALVAVERHRAPTPQQRMSWLDPLRLEAVETVEGWPDTPTGHTVAVLLRAPSGYEAQAISQRYGADLAAAFAVELGAAIVLAVTG